MKLRFKKLKENAITPTRGSEYAAGYDLYCIEDLMIVPHNSVKVDTGLAIEIPEGYFGALFARSGLACENNIRPANCVGVIDADYRGPICAVLFNDQPDTCIKILAGSRIAQLVIIPYQTVELEETSELSDTVRGEGGFGSTGK